MNKENGLGCGRRHLALTLWLVGAMIGVMLAGWAVVMSAVEKRVSNHEIRMRALESQGTRSEIKLDYLIIKVDAITSAISNTVPRR